MDYPFMFGISLFGAPTLCAADGQSACGNWIKACGRISPLQAAFRLRRHLVRVLRICAAPLADSKEDNCKSVMFYALVVHLFPFLNWQRAVCQKMCDPSIVNILSSM